MFKLSLTLMASFGGVVFVGGGDGGVVLKCVLLASDEYDTVPITIVIVAAFACVFKLQVLITVFKYCCISR